MPGGGRILHAGIQQGRLCIWAQVTPGAPEQTVRVHVRSTGDALGDAEFAQYVDTIKGVDSQNRDVVSHIWARTVSPTPIALLS